MIEGRARKMATALDGIRIIDFTRVVAGPSCTQLLGDLGADVIKVERPGVGDSLRAPTRGYDSVRGESCTFLGLNRNKRSIALDLTQDRGKAIVYRLAEKSDVVVQNFRPGVMNRLGLGYETLKRHNPGIIYASASGYGLSGPYAEKGGQDLIAQAMGGIMSFTGGPEGPPTEVGAPIADYIGGLLLAQAITTALLVRERNGIGQEVDIALLDTQLPLQVSYITEYATLGELRRRRGNLYRVYKTKDGYIALAGSFQPNPLGLVCSALGLEDLSKDPRFDTRDKIGNSKELAETLERAIEEKTTAECVKLLEDKDVLCGPVNTHREVVNDPQVQHNNMIIEIEHPVAGKFRTAGNPIRLSETPGSVRMPPPALGQHTDEVLAFLGYTEEEVATLREQRVIG